MAEPESLVGHRFVTDFVVESITGDVVILRRYGEIYVISLAELKTVIETGFVIEAGRES